MVSRHGYPVYHRCISIRRYVENQRSFSSIDSIYVGIARIPERLAPGYFDIWVKYWIDWMMFEWNFLFSSKAIKSSMFLWSLQHVFISMAYAFFLFIKQTLVTVGKMWYHTLVLLSIQIFNEKIKTVSCPRFWSEHLNFLFYSRLLLFSNCFPNR